MPAFRLRAPAGPRGWIAVVLFGWGLLALVQAAQGYAVAAWLGQPQPWWPSIGYSAAIYSIWVLLTWPIIRAVLTVERGIRRWWLRVAAYLALWPVVAGAHVLLFGLIYWPLYRGEAVPTRGAMVELMFVRNFDSNTMLYAAMVALTIGWTRWPRRAAPVQRAASDDALLIRARGRVQRIPFAAIDWIGAAGDYAEIHSEGRTYLIEESLTSLAARLPADDFARIHRGALIRLDRVRAIDPIGRGDAYVRLNGGQQLRLSRRFRDNLAALLHPPAQPAE